MQKLALPLMFLVLVSLAGAQTTYPTKWTNAGQTTAGTCRSVLTQDGQPVDQGSIICFSDTSFDSNPGFSIYLPVDPTTPSSYLILESCSISYGSYVKTKGDGTHAGDTLVQTDTFTCNLGYAPWIGTQVENFVKASAMCRVGSGRYYHLSPCLVNVDTGGGGNVQTTY